MFFRFIKYKFNFIVSNYRKSQFLKWIQSNSRKDNSFISQNCIGGRFYKLIDMPFLSPTVGLWFEPNDFLNFIENLENNLQSELNYDYCESIKYKYPIGRVNGVKIHFMHYETFEFAKTKWIERSLRVDISKVVILMTDRDGFSYEHKNRFFNLPFERKILFTHLPSSLNDSEVYIPGYEREEFIGDLYSEYQQFNVHSVKQKLLKMIG